MKMTIALLILIACNISLVIGGNYSLPALKDEVTSTWTLSAFASMIRDAILSANPFPWDFVKKTLDSDNDLDLMATAQEVIMIELPLLIPCILGLLCVFLVPVITFIFCCCRCCCRNCRAKLALKDIQNQNRKAFVLNVLNAMILVGILCAMGSCVPPSGDRLKTSPRMIYRVVEASLDDIKIFLDKFVQDASELAKTTLNTTLEQIKSELDDLPDALAKPVTDGASPFIGVIDSKIGFISNGILNLTITNTTLKGTVDNITGLLDDLQTGLATINNRWTSLKSQCVTDGEIFCNLLPDGAGPDALNIDVNTTELTDTTDIVSELVASANSVNLSEYQNLANTTFIEIPKTIRNASQTAIDSVKVSLDDVPAEIDPVIDDALEAADVDMDFSTILDPLDSNISLFEEQYSLQRYIFLAIGAVFIVLSLIVSVGLLLGCLCTKQPHGSVLSGRTKAGNWGARMLIIYVCVAVLPVTISLLIGSISMLIGANLTILCQPLQDLTIFEELVDNGLLFGGESLGKTLLNDESFNVSITYLFKTCRSNGTVFKGLNIESGMDLMSHFNASEFVPDLGQDVIDEVNTTVSGINIVDTSLFDDLSSKLDIPDIDTSIISTIITEINSLQLTDTSQNMSTLADSLTDVDYKNAYSSISTDLQKLHDNTSVPLISAVNSVQTSVNGINSSCINMKTVITELSSSLDNLTNFIGSQAVTVIVQALDDFLAGMLKVPEDMIDSILKALNSDVGHCVSLADVYDTFLASVCGYFLSSFNTLWAAFFTGGMTAAILMISSCTLTKYFRTPDDFLQTRLKQHLNIGNHATSSNQPRVDVVLTKFQNLHNGSRDENNNAAFASDRYQRINEQWRQRRRLLPAQLFRTMTESRKINPEPADAFSKLRSTPSINVDNDNDTLDMQDMVKSECRPSEDGIQIFDLENDYSYAEGCNMDEANAKSQSEKLTRKVDDVENALESDNNVSDDIASMTGPRNDSHLSNDYEIYESCSSRKSLQNEHDYQRNAAFWNKQLTHSAKNLDDITKKSTVTDVIEANVDINQDKSLLFPVKQMNGERNNIHLQDAEADNEAKMITQQQKMISGQGQGELWLQKYRIKDAAKNNKFEKLSKSCHEHLNVDSESIAEDFAPPYQSNSIADDLGALGSGSSNVSKQHVNSDFPNTIQECYTGGKIVCALCKNKNINQNTIDNCKPDKSNDISVNKRFDAKISNSLKPKKDFATCFHQSISDQLKAVPYNSSAKLDVIVQPYKSHNGPLSPRESFLFWRHMDGECNSNTEPDVKHHSYVYDILSETFGVNEQIDRHKNEVLKKVQGLKEPLLNNVESQRSTPLRLLNLLEPKLESSIETGRMAYCYNYYSQVCDQTSRPRRTFIKKDGTSEEKTVLQPKSLSDLATMAVMSSERSVFYPNTSNPYGSASTRRDSIPVTYC